MTYILTLDEYALMGFSQRQVYCDNRWCWPITNRDIVFTINKRLTDRLTPTPLGPNSDRCLSGYASTRKVWSQKLVKLMHFNNQPFKKTYMFQIYLLWSFTFLRWKDGFRIPKALYRVNAKIINSNIEYITYHFIPTTWCSCYFLLWVCS